MVIDPIMILLIVLILLSLGGWGWGYYGATAGPATGAGPSPMVNGLGILALIFIVALVVMLATGWRFDFGVHQP